MKNEDYATCQVCKEALVKDNASKSEKLLVDMKTRGRLIHANKHFFNLINYVEKCFVKHACNSNVFDLTVDEVLETYEFTFPCKEHGSDILAYSIFYYVRLRMRQFTFQENLKNKKKSVVQRKMAKLNKT